MRWPLNIVTLPVYLVVFLVLFAWNLVPDTINLALVGSIGYLLVYITNSILRTSEPAFKEDVTSWDSLSATVQASLIIELILWILAVCQFVTTPGILFWLFNAGAILLIIFGVEGCLFDNGKTPKCVE